MSLLLLRCLGRAVVKHGPRALAGCIPFGESLFDIAFFTIAEWKKACQSAADRHLQLETLAQVEVADLRQQAKQVAREVAPPELQGQLADYLERLPGVVRRSLSRPADPSGRTAPAGLPLNRPEDLIPFLPARPPRFRPGDRPGGLEHWKLEELLGVGGFGEVWRALDDQGRQVALKFCLDPASADSLRHEADLLQRVQNQNWDQAGLVPLLAAHLDADPPCLVFDYIPGGDLTRLIRCWHSSQPRPAKLVQETVRLVSYLARIVGRAHNLGPPVCHRDLKPSNILLHPPQGTRVRPRVSDFGIGGIAAQQAMVHSRRASAKEKLTTSLRGAHTPLYASPQQQEGKPPDPRDDVYALGVIGYQTLVGDPTVAPLASMRDELIDREVSNGVIQVLESCLSEEAEDRPHTATHLFQLLQGLLPHLPS
jgi:serine/threonine protein kinase